MLHYFSSAGYTVSKTRSSVRPNIVIKLVYVWDWCCYFQFSIMSVTLNWLMILLSLLNSTIYVLFFT